MLLRFVVLEILRDHFNTVALGAASYESCIEPNHENEGVVFSLRTSRASNLSKARLVTLR